MSSTEPDSIAERGSSAATATIAQATANERGLGDATGTKSPRVTGYWTGKVVIVTGASSGLGRALAEEFAQAGANVVVSARTLETLRAVADELGRFGTQVVAISADVTKQDQVETLIEKTITQFGRLDAVVNNVGRSTRGALADTTPEDFANLMEINFLPAVRVTRAALPHLIRSRGHIVNIGSLSGKSASRYVGAYSATKFAMSAYTQQLRMELRPQGVHVMLVSPGPILRDDAGERYADQMQGLPATRPSRERACGFRRCGRRSFRGQY